MTRIKDRTVDFATLVPIAGAGVADVPAGGVLLEDAAKAILDAYSEAAVTVAEKVGPDVVNIAAMRRESSRATIGAMARVRVLRRGLRLDLALL